jgi:hypothetical protein
MFRLAVALTLTGAMGLVSVPAISQEPVGTERQSHPGPVRQDRGQLGASVNTLGLQNTLERHQFGAAAAIGFSRDCLGWTAVRSRS